MDYIADDKQLNASVFLSFVNQIWPGSYDAERTQNAKTDNMLTGCEKLGKSCLPKAQ